MIVSKTAMDYWDGVSPLEFKALMADEDMEEFRSEKSVTTGKVCYVFILS